MRSKGWLLSLIVAGATFLGCITSQAQNSVLSQLGVKGVAEKIEGTNSALYAGYLLKTGADGLLDSSWLSGSLATPVVWNKVLFLDSVNGGDGTNDNGTVTRPYKTFTNALANAEDGTTFVFAPGTYAPPSVVTNAFVTNMTFIGLDPDNTSMSGQLKFGNDNDIVLNIYRMTVNEIRQQDYRDIDVSLYEQAVVTSITRQYPLAVNSVLTLYRDPSITLITPITTSNSSEILTHNAVDIAYDVTVEAHWWTNIFGVAPVNVEQGLDSLAGRALTVHGTNMGQMAYWNGTNWNIVAKGHERHVLFGSTNPVFRLWGEVYDAVDVPYYATNGIGPLGTNNWLAWVGAIPTNVEEALDYAADFAVPHGTTNTGEMSSWDGTDWQIVSRGYTNLFLRGGSSPEFSLIWAYDAQYAATSTNDWDVFTGANPTNVRAALDLIAGFAVPHGTNIGQMAYWTGAAWELVDSGTTNEILQGGTQPRFVTAAVLPPGTNAGQVAYWDGSAWAIVPAGATNQVLFGGTDPAFANQSIFFDTNSMPYDFVPFVTDTYSIGTTNLQWQYGWFSGDVYIGGTSVLAAITSAGLTTNDSPTMADGTAWSFNIMTFDEMIGFTGTIQELDVQLLTNGTHSIDMFLGKFSPSFWDFTGASVALDQVSGSQLGSVGAILDLSGGPEALAVGSWDFTNNIITIGLKAAAGSPQILNTADKMLVGAWHVSHTATNTVNGDEIVNYSTATNLIDLLAASTLQDVLDAGNTSTNNSMILTNGVIVARLADSIYALDAVGTIRVEGDIIPSGMGPWKVGTVAAAFSSAYFNDIFAGVVFINNTNTGTAIEWSGPGGIGRLGTGAGTESGYFANQGVTYEAKLGAFAEAAYFTDGTRHAHIADGTSGGIFSNALVFADLVGSGGAGLFQYSVNRLALLGSAGHAAFINDGVHFVGMGDDLSALNAYNAAGSNVTLIGSEYALDVTGKSIIQQLGDITNMVWETNGLTTAYGDLYARGNALYGQRELPVVITNDTQLELTDSGKLFVVSGAEDIAITLPTNAVASTMGTKFRFVNTTTNLLIVQAHTNNSVDDSDVGGAIYSGSNLSNNWPWSSIEVVQADSNWWHATARRGTWTTTGVTPSTIPVAELPVTWGGLETYLLALTQDIIPAASNVYDLGSLTLPFKDLYLGPGSLYINGEQALNASGINVATGVFEIAAIANDIAFTGTNVHHITSTNGSLTIGMNDPDLFSGPSIRFDPVGDTILIHAWSTNVFEMGSVQMWATNFLVRNPLGGGAMQWHPTKGLQVSDDGSFAAAPGITFDVEGKSQFSDDATFGGFIDVTGTGTFGDFVAVAGGVSFGSTGSFGGTVTIHNGDIIFTNAPAGPDTPTHIYAQNNDHALGLFGGNDDVQGAYIYLPGSGYSGAMPDSGDWRMVLDAGVNGQDMEFLVGNDAGDRGMLSFQSDYIVNGHGRTWTNLGTISVTGSVYMAAGSWLDLGGGAITNLGTSYITGDFLPTVADTYNLGSAALPFAAIYLTEATIYMGSNSMSISNGQIVVVDGTNDPTDYASQEWVTDLLLSTSWATDLNTTQTFDNIIFTGTLLGLDVVAGTVAMTDGTANFTATQGIQIVNYSVLTNAIAGVDLSAYVPYSGATGDVVLGAQSLTANGVTATNWVKTLVIRDLVSGAEMINVQNRQLLGFSWIVTNQLAAKQLWSDALGNLVLDLSSPGTDPVAWQNWDFVSAPKMPGIKNTAGVQQIDVDNITFNSTWDFVAAPKMPGIKNAGGIQQIDVNNLTLNSIWSQIGIGTSGYELMNFYAVTNHLMNVTHSIIPAVSNQYSLGSPAKPWANLYVEPATIYMGNSALSVSNGQLLVAEGTNDPVDYASQDWVTAQAYLQTGAAGTSTNLSQYNNDAGFITNADLSTVVPYTGATADLAMGAHNVYVGEDKFMGLSATYHFKWDTPRCRLENAIFAIDSTTPKMEMNDSNGDDFFFELNGSRFNIAHFGGSLIDVYVNDSSYDTTINGKNSLDAAPIVKFKSHDAGGPYVAVYTNTGVPSTTAGAAEFYSIDEAGTAEMWVQDDAGNNTRLSSHDGDIPVYYSFNVFTGRRYKKNMWDGTETKDFVAPTEDWDVRETEKQADRAAKRTEWDDLDAVGESRGQKPKAYPKKSKPQWVTDGLTANPLVE